MNKLLIATAITAALVYSVSHAAAPAATAAPVQKDPDATFTWDDPQCPYDLGIIPMATDEAAAVESISPEIWPYYRRCTGTAYAALRLNPHTAKLAVQRIIDAKCVSIDKLLVGVVISDTQYAKLLPYLEIVQTPLPGRYMAYEVTCTPAPEIWITK